jgi:hypothetical protein
MRELRQEIGAVKAIKQAGGPMFPVRGAKDLALKLANALNKLNMEAPVIASEVSNLECDRIPGNATSSGKPVFRTLAHVKSTVRLIAPNTSFIDMVGSGHGGDVDDKSGGKASTYAWKDAILKGLSIPHDDMVDTDDESTTTPVIRAALTKTMDAPGPDMGHTNASGLETVSEQIGAATTVAQLEAIKKAIQDNVIALHGQDRLKASALYVARKKTLEASGGAAG